MKHTNKILLYVVMLFCYTQSSAGGDFCRAGTGLSFDHADIKRKPLSSAPIRVKAPVFSTFSASHSESIWSPSSQQTSTLEQTTTFTHSSSIENITLTTADGLSRNGVLTLRENAKGNVIMSHPAAYNKDFFIPFEDAIFYEYNTLRFDFRRHGENSEKQFSTLGQHETQEIQAAIQAFADHPKTAGLPLFGFGISMGAATLIEAERKHKAFDALILQAPYECLKRQVRRLIPLFRIPLMKYFIFSPISQYFAKSRYRLKLRKIRPMKSVQEIDTPIFLIHAQDDPTVDFKAFKRLTEVGKSIVKTWAPETGKHTALFKTRPDEYAQKCLDFLKELTR